ncbi:MAG TPA: alpha-L-fucosidase [Flavitalea sp.]|nr:alpha-L-fucosidase [Flavitalea sp.]
MKYLLFLFFIGYNLSVCAQKRTGPVPTSEQLEWHEMEFYLFIHFGPNTFTDVEWGTGKEDAKVFNPTALDCNQWVKIAKQAGAKGIILTAKHHDGFCLWPSNYSTHTVRESNWKKGRGNVVRELSIACENAGLKFGVYISPWDRNHPKYGTPQYNDVYVRTMTELLTNYGRIFELWWDGANGEGPNGKKQAYDFRRFEKMARTLSPRSVIFSDIGPDIRWVGNERGHAGETNWNLLDTAGFSRGIGAPPTDTLNRGNENGHQWIPAECDVSIRPGWFYHKREDSLVKTPAQLFDLYLKSVGRGANFLLNVPPDQRGLFHSADSASLMGFKRLLDENFKTNLLKNAVVELRNGKIKKTKKLTDGYTDTYESLPTATDPGISIELEKEIMLNTISLREYINVGQTVKKFTIRLLDKQNDLAREIQATTIGRKRILTFPGVKVKKITITILEAKAAVVISEIAAYNIDEGLVEK